MEQSAEAPTPTNVHSRFVAVCLAVFLAISMGCGIGAAALADGFEDLDSAVQDALVLAQEESAASMMPAKPVNRVRRDTVRARSGGDDLIPVAASKPRPDQVPYVHRNGGMPRAINPTGPPLRV